MHVFRHLTSIPRHSCLICVGWRSNAASELFTNISTRLAARRRSAGIATGYVRRATGSTFNTVLIHVINNVVLLTLGLHLFGH
jgi:hypothetical protein